MLAEELKSIAVHEREAEAGRTACISVCAAASCQALQSEELKKALTQAAAAQGHGPEACTVRQVGCLGLCGAGPLVSVEPGGILYQRVQPSDAEEIVTALDGAPVERLRLDSQMPFFTRQHRIVLENSGRIDPDRMEDYIARDGYLALSTVLHEMQPADVIAEVGKAGLRGRGGAGYPTGLKWETVAKSAGSPKIIVCNADEGDPGAFMDRSVLESDPHRVLEGMAIAAYAVGASEGYIYVRAEYPLAVARLKTALRNAERHGLLGGDICGSHFTFRIAIRLGAGAFVCGEETALIASIQGLRGTPKPRPPYPAQVGLWGHPTLINNVETFANIAPIIRNGGAWFSKLGTERSKGTKVFRAGGPHLEHGADRGPDGHQAARHHLRRRRRDPRWQALQSRADGRAVGRLHSRGVFGHAGGLRNADQPGLHHGIGRDDRDGRNVVDGGRSALLHGVLHDGIVRQMHSVPRGYGADVRIAGAVFRAAGADGGSANARKAVRSGAQHQLVRVGAICAESGVEYAAVFSAGI